MNVQSDLAQQLHQWGQTGFIKKDFMSTFVVGSAGCSADFRYATDWIQTEFMYTCFSYTPEWTNKQKQLQTDFMAHTTQWTVKQRRCYHGNVIPQTSVAIWRWIQHRLIGHGAVCLALLHDLTAFCSLCCIFTLVMWSMTGKHIPEFIYTGPLSACLEGPSTPGLWGHVGNEEKPQKRVQSW